MLVTVGFLMTTDTEAAAIANPDVDFIGIDQFLEEYPAEHGRRRRSTRTRAATSPACSPRRSARAESSASSPAVRTFRRWSSSSTATPPAPSRSTPTSACSRSTTRASPTPAKGASDAAQFIGEGADVIFGAGGPTGSGRRQGRRRGGRAGRSVSTRTSTSPRSPAAPLPARSSSPARPSSASTSSRSGSSPTRSRTQFEGGLVVGTAANDLITYAEAHDADLPEPRQSTAVEAARVGLADGSVTTGICGIDGLFAR